MPSKTRPGSPFRLLAGSQQLPTIPAPLMRKLASAPTSPILHHRPLLQTGDDDHGRGDEATPA